jgi:ferredoxin
MKLNLMYFSPTNTTEKILKSIAKGISSKYIDYDITLRKNRTEKIIFEKDDLLILGIPVYGGRIPAILEEYLKSIKGNDSRLFITAVYGNRHYDDILLELKDIFTVNGFEVVGAAAFIGEHSFTKKVAENRPDNSDLSKAFNLGKNILEKISNSSNFKPFIPGNHPYKARKSGEPYGPITNNLCTNCGICASSCPVEAIDFDNCTIVDTKKCIHCASCIKKCPLEAKSFDSEYITKIINFLEENCSIRKEPEIFF